MDKAWEIIFEKYRIHSHDFDSGPYLITAEEIKEATKKLKKTSEREVRILCKQDRREDRPEVFKNKNLFILPISNGEYAILKGEGYIDIPDIPGPAETYFPKLSFRLDTLQVGNSEMQHLDFAFAMSLIKHFVEDESLVLTIRGRKYTPEFSFKVGKYRLTAKSVQTEVDAGYEGKDKVILIEAKNSKADNVIIRQLFYPFRQWQCFTNKKVINVFFEKRQNEYRLWNFEFEDPNDYNSIRLLKSKKYVIVR